MSSAALFKPSRRWRTSERRVAAGLVAGLICPRVDISSLVDLLD
ncbi:MAG: hypothetical protein JWL70_2385 [Acidimicrobiia bacterium]|nr:hypothetical protein [Acidimicrobiia bacterium]